MLEKKKQNKKTKQNKNKHKKKTGSLRACLHGAGGPKVGELTRFGA